MNTVDKNISLHGVVDWAMLLLQISFEGIQLRLSLPWKWSAMAMALLCPSSLQREKWLNWLPNWKNCLTAGQRSRLNRKLRRSKWFTQWSRTDHTDTPAPAFFLECRCCFYHNLRRNNRLLFPPFSRYRCSVSTRPAFLRSFNALRVVDSESFRSFAMVGIDGQQLSFFPARSARYMYTDIALWGRSIRYSFVTLLIISTSFFMQAPVLEPAFIHPPDSVLPV